MKREASAVLSASAPVAVLVEEEAQAAPSTVPATAAPAASRAPASAPAVSAEACGREACVHVACEDRRIARSKQALREAMVQLIEERGLNNFSASDLCTRAGLNRGTLYNNFGGLEGLLKALEDDVMADLVEVESHMGRIELADVARYGSGKTPMPFLVELFDCLRGQGDFLHAILGPGGDPAFARRLQESVCTEILQSILHEHYRNDPEPIVQYYVSFYASAYLGVIERWIETGMQESSQDMARICMRLFFMRPGESIKL